MAWCEYCGYCEHGECADPCPCPGSKNAAVKRPEREIAAAKAYWEAFHSFCAEAS